MDLTTREELAMRALQQAKRHASYSNSEARKRTEVGPVAKLATRLHYEGVARDSLRDAYERSVADQDGPTFVPMGQGVIAREAAAHGYFVRDSMVERDVWGDAR